MGPPTFLGIVGLTSLLSPSQAVIFSLFEASPLVFLIALQHSVPHICPALSGSIAITTPAAGEDNVWVRKPTANYDCARRPRRLPSRCEAIATKLQSLPLLPPIPQQSLRRVKVSRDRTRAGGGTLAEESRLASQRSESAPLQLTTMSSPSC